MSDFKTGDVVYANLPPLGYGPKEILLARIVRVNWLTYTVLYTMDWEDAPRETHIKKVNKRKVFSR